MIAPSSVRPATGKEAAMRIVDVKLYILENPAQQGRSLKLVQVPNLLRTQYTHTSH
jgi:hypothetical protein